MTTRFVVDSMLEKLARYLRCAGADAHSDASATTARLVELADREGRLFLTRNRHLVHHSLVPQRLHPVTATDPVAQFNELRAAGHLEGAEPFTRCIRCNLPLVPLALEDAAPRVPARIATLYREFFTCPACTTVFWRGSHVRNTCRKLGIADVSERGVPDGR